MFKKFKKKTKIVFGAAAVSATVFFPIATIAAAPVTAPAAPAAASSAPATNIFSKNDGTIVESPDKVITVNGLSTTNFQSQLNAQNLLLKTPDALEKFIPGTKDIFNNDAKDPIQAAKDSSFSLKGYNPTGIMAYSTFLLPDTLKSLYKDLNVGYDKKAQTKTRFDFAVPSQVTDVNDLDSASSTMKSSSISSFPFKYKIAEIDPEKIVENEALSLDYMYSKGGSTKKVQLIIPHSDDLTSDTKTLKDLFDSKEIFFRSMDAADREKSASISGGFDLATSGLSITKDKDGISLYTSLSSKSDTASIMIDDDTTTAAATSTTIGFLEQSTQPDGVTIAGATPNDLVSDFDEYTISNDWRTTTSYSWKDGDVTSAQQIDLYLREGADIANIELSYAAMPELKEHLSIKAEGGQVTILPKTPISVLPEKYTDGDKAFESSWQNSGLWYKVTLTVPKNQASQYLISLNNSSEETAWTMKKDQKQQEMFFEDPSATDWTGIPSHLVSRTIQKKVNDEAATTEAYQKVYGSWIQYDQKAITDGLDPEVLVTTKEAAQIYKGEVVGNKNPWLGFKYHNPSSKAVNFDDKDSPLKSIPEHSTMQDVINILNTYHNHLYDLEEAAFHNTFDGGIDGKDAYKPTTTTDFSKFFTFILKTGGAFVPAKADGTPGDQSLSDHISLLIAEADKIIKVNTKTFDDELKLWNKEADHTSYKSQYPTGGAIPPVDILAMQKDLRPSDFDKIIALIKPTDPKSPDTTGSITVAVLVKDIIQQIIPKLFENEWASFKNTMASVKGVRFADFLSGGLTSTKTFKVLDASSIVSGTSPSGVHFVDINENPKLAPVSKGSELVKGFMDLIYKTGFYKSIFATEPRLKEEFVKLYDEKTPDSVLWDDAAYRDVTNKQMPELFEVLQKVFDTLKPEGVKTSFYDALGDETDSRQAFEDLVASTTTALTNGEHNVLFEWTAGNEYKGTFLQKQVILSNIESVVEYLKTNSKAKELGQKLDKFISTFSANVGSDTAIAQLGPTLGRYKIESFIPGFSSDPTMTSEIIEQMIHVDPIRVLIPNTGQSKTFKVLENKGGTATLGLVIAAGVLIFIIGGVLIGLSFTKRLVVGGNTWSWKMIIIRVALVAVAVVGIYMVLSGTVLPGHTALTTIVNV